VTEDPPADGDGTATGDGDGTTTADADVVVELQQALRSEFKQPFGPIYTDTDALLADANPPLVTVGDIVTYHLTTAGRTPDVALVDGRTKRTAVEDHIQETIQDDTFDRERKVVNPPATLSAGLLDALRVALADAAEGTTTIIVVDGEEDLAALPAIAIAPDGATIVYGQPDEGMVRVTGEPDTRDRMCDLLGRLDGDTQRLWSLLGTDDLD
jgi:uncharacterized protein (UPF0218 family)